MEGSFDALRENEASNKLLKQKMILSSRKIHRSELDTYSEEPLYERTNSLCSGKIDETTKEKVAKKLKRERKFLKKWTVELNQAKDEIYNNANIANECSSVDSKISEIEKRYHILLPAIQLAMETMQQAALSKSSLSQSRTAQGSLVEDSTARGIAQRKILRQLNESRPNAVEPCEPKLFTTQKNFSNADSRNSLMTDISKLELAKRLKNQNIPSTTHSAKAKDSDDVQNFHPVLVKETDVKEPSKQRYKPGANGELFNEMNLSNSAKNFVKKRNLLSTKSLVTHFPGDKVLRKVRRNRATDKAITKPRSYVVSVKNQSKSNFRKVEQNVLCTEPNVMTAYSTSSLTSDSPSDFVSNGLRQSQTSLKAASNSHSVKSKTEQIICKCKNKKDSEPCICNCYCEEERISNVPKMPQSPELPIVSSIASDGRSHRSSLSSYTKNLESVQVQTSFPSSIGPCKPDNCPKRKKRPVGNRNIEVQTDDTDIEWQYEPMPLTRPIEDRCPKRNDIKKNAIGAFKIPPKRTETMDDRLLRRIMYFDTHQSSVCNKNVQFCTYSVHQAKKCFPKNAENVVCQDCPGSRMCNLVLSQHPYHLTCNEIVVEVKSLELKQEGVECLKKVCSFLYIDYVFLGHVGNETSLAPLSDKIIFDSRKSYSVSLRFNKKERSILREQFNPSGLLAKDTIMFIIVCQAAPEFDIYKNWDFGFGYLSMKHIGDQMKSEDQIRQCVEMQKIGGTKNNIGRLVVTIEGLKTIKSIMNEELHCMEPRVDAVMEKLKLNKKELIAAENNQTSCKRRTSKKETNIKH